MCVRDIDFAHVSMIFQLDFGCYDSVVFLIFHFIITKFL